MSCSLVDDLIPCVDEARGLSESLGIENREFFVVTEAKNEDTGNWTEKSRLRITPFPTLTPESSLRWATQPQGRILEGLIMATGISLRYKREELCPITESNPANFRLRYEIVAGDGKKSDFTAASQPFEDRENVQWVMRLSATAPAGLRR